MYWGPGGDISRTGKSMFEMFLGMAYNFQKYSLDRIQHLGAPYDTGESLSIRYVIVSCHASSQVIALNMTNSCRTRLLWRTISMATKSLRMELYKHAWSRNHNIKRSITNSSFDQYSGWLCLLRNAQSQQPFTVILYVTRVRDALRRVCLR